MAKKTADPLKAKQKKQKIMLAVGGVLLLGLLAFQVPRVMKKMHVKPPPHHPFAATTTAAPPAGTPALAAPTLSGAEQASAPAANTGSGLSSADAAPPAQQGQLAAFSRFSSKDPFAQQVAEGTTGTSGGPSPSSGGSGSPTTTPVAGSTPSVPRGTSLPAPGSAVISVNGTLTSVAVGADFPQAQPLFHLVSLTAHTARISIAGGSYSNGAATVTLRENRPLTLQNTADGTRYTLLLKPQGTAVPSSPGATATTTPAVTLPSATP